MCRQITCKTCGKASWAGCGQHAETVMAAVPRAQRCPGHPDQRRSDQPGTPTAVGSFLARLVRRG